MGIVSRSACQSGGNPRTLAHVTVLPLTCSRDVLEELSDVVVVDEARQTHWRFGGARSPSTDRRPGAEEAIGENQVGVSEAAVAPSDQVRAVPAREANVSSAAQQSVFIVGIGDVGPRRFGCDR